MRSTRENSSTTRKRETKQTMRKISIAFFVFFGFTIMSYGQRFSSSLEMGGGLAFPFSKNPIGFHAFLNKYNVYIPLTKTGDLILGTGILYYKINTPIINNYHTWVDDYSFSYSYNFVDRPNFVGRFFGGYHLSGLIFHTNVIQHGVLLGLEGGIDYIVLRFSLMKAINPIRISTSEGINNIFPTVLTLSILYFP